MEFDNSLAIKFPVSLMEDEFVVAPPPAEEAEVVPALVALIKFDVICAEDAAVGGFVIADPPEMNVVDWTVILFGAEGVLIN